MLFSLPPFYAEHTECQHLRNVSWVRVPVLVLPQQQKSPPLFRGLFCFLAESWGNVFQSVVRSERNRKSIRRFPFKGRSTHAVSRSQLPSPAGTGYSAEWCQTVGGFHGCGHADEGIRAAVVNEPASLEPHQSFGKCGVCHIWVAFFPVEFGFEKRSVEARDQFRGFLAVKPALGRNF